MALTRIKHLLDIPGKVYHGTTVVRIHGLLGDNILAATRFRWIRNKHKAPLTLVSTYTHPHCERQDLLPDLYRELLEDGTITQIFSHPVGNFLPDENHVRKLLHRGAKGFYGPTMRDLKRIPVDPEGPYLGAALRERWQTKASPRRVAIFRWSGYHAHARLRLRPYNDWRQIEKTLVDAGYEVVLFGWDDPLPRIYATEDYRKKLSIYETLWEAATCGQLISVTTFLPVYCQFFMPCYVLTDPTDIGLQRKIWQMRHEAYQIIDVSKPFIKPILEKVKTYGQHQEDFTPASS